MEIKKKNWTNPEDKIALTIFAQANLGQQNRRAIISTEHPSVGPQLNSRDKHKRLK